MPGPQGSEPLIIPRDALADPARAPDILAALRDGAAPASAMVPDPLYPGNRPRHHETYDLPHVLIAGERAWCHSRCAHLLRREATGLVDPEPVCFAYGINQRGTFGTWQEGTGISVWMPLHRYATFTLHLRPWVRVWDSDGDDRPEALTAAIAAARRLRVVLHDDQGLWRIHPVDLPMIEDGGRVILRTEPVLQPRELASPAFVDRLVADHPQLLDPRPDPDALLVRETMPLVSTWFCIDSDGTYYTRADMTHQQSRYWRRLVIVAEP